MSTKPSISVPYAPAGRPPAKPTDQRRANIPRGSAPTAPLNIRLTYRALDRLEMLRDALAANMVLRPSRSVTMSMILEGLCDMEGNVYGRLT